MFYHIKKWFSKFEGGGGGLYMPGPWRVSYPPDKYYPTGGKSRWLRYGDCKNLQMRFGGTLEYKEDVNEAA